MYQTDASIVPESCLEQTGIVNRLYDMRLPILFRKGLLVILAGSVLTGVAGFVWIFYDLPDVASLPTRLNYPSISITDRHGRLLYEVLPEQGGRHAVVNLESIPLALQQATIATEDRNFYTNPGVDILGVIRSAWINLSGGQTIAGGSTITQQVARNLLMGDEERLTRTMRRKLREIALAWQIDQAYSKGEILAMYLNQTYFGGMAIGVEAAAQTFFAKPVRELDLAESALLAGLPQAPAVYNPFTDEKAARKRQAVVLGLMQHAGYITQEQRDQAAREPLVFAETPYPIEAPHFVMMVRDQIDSMFSVEDIQDSGGLVVQTSLDLDWQKHAERAVHSQLAALAKSEDGLGHNVNNAALVALNPANGEILALVGSPDYFDPTSGGAINMAISPRQPGSALKPLVYAAALDPTSADGGWTAATMILDVKTAFQTHQGRAYIPQNYDLREHGPVLVRQALASSLNIPAVAALEHIGLQNLFSLANQLGITTLKDPHAYDLSLALGGGEVRLMELVAAYGAFANGGFRVEPIAILEIQDMQGNIRYQHPEVTRSRVIDEKVAWLISDMLSDNNARRLGFGENSLLRLDRPAAVKTGTTSNFHDNWTVGYTPDMVVGVWSGNTNYEPMRDVNGLSGAAPIWHQFLRTVLSGSPEREFERPDGLVRIEICALSGALPSQACPYRKWEWFIEGTQPTEQDTLYQMVAIDSVTGFPAQEETPIEQRTQILTMDLPPQAHAWAQSQGIVLYQELTSSSESSIVVERTPDLRVLTPASGSVFHLAPNIDPTSQRILISVASQVDVQSLSFYVDNQVIGQKRKAPYQSWWALLPGEHQIWVEALARDGSTLTSEVINISVLSGPAP